MLPRPPARGGPSGGRGAACETGTSSLREPDLGTDWEVYASRARGGTANALSHHLVEPHLHLLLAPVAEDAERHLAPGFAVVEQGGDLGQVPGGDVAVVHGQHLVAGAQAGALGRGVLQHALDRDPLRALREQQAGARQVVAVGVVLAGLQVDLPAVVVERDPEALEDAVADVARELLARERA